MWPQGHPSGWTVPTVTNWLSSRTILVSTAVQTSMRSVRTMTTKYSKQYGPQYSIICKECKGEFITYFKKAQFCSKWCNRKNRVEAYIAKLWNSTFAAAAADAPVSFGALTTRLAPIAANIIINLIQLTHAWWHARAIIYGDWIAEKLAKELGIKVEYAKKEVKANDWRDGQGHQNLRNQRRRQPLRVYSRYVWLLLCKMWIYEIQTIIFFLIKAAKWKLRLILRP